MENNCNIVFIEKRRLGLYGPHAEQIILTALSEMKNASRRGVDFSDVRVGRECNDEVFVGNAYSLEYYPVRPQWMLEALQGYSDAEVRKMFANRLKRIVKDLDRLWTRGSTEQAFGQYTVGQVYAVYDALLGRTKQVGRFGESEKSAVGESFDPAKTEIERVKEEETARIVAECVEKIKAIQDDRRKKENRIENILDRLVRLERARIEQAKLDRDKALKDLAESLASA